MDSAGGQRSGVDADELARTGSGLPQHSPEERAGPERRRLLERLHHVQEEERARIAVGLHDGPLQGLATLGFKLARARVLLAEGDAEAAGAVEARVPVPRP